MARWDVIVIGAGPGGAAAARAASAGGLRVLVVEAGRWPRRKACGGVLSADALGQAEERFGPTPLHALADPPILRQTRVHLSGTESYTAPLSWPAIRVERKAFDAHLIGHAGADLRARTRVLNFEQTEFGVDLELEAGVLEAKVVVVAAGAGSTLAPVRGVRRSLAFASRVNYRATGQVEGREWLLLDTPEDGLAAIDPERDGILSIVTMVKDPRRWKQSQAQAIRIAQSLGLGIEVEQEAEFGWLARGGPWLGIGKVLVVGDAAGLGLALGFGLESALESGEAAGRAAVEAIQAGAELQAAYKECLRPLLRRRQAERRLHSMLRLRLAGLDGQQDLGEALSASFTKRGALGMRLSQTIQALDVEEAPPKGFRVGPQE
ncbi:MAG: FAD-dependent oxidoreductase [Planctomycetes bacterium]|nr:FAD-dependent oxidoreductase [Planctomycetota bacterium]